MNKKKLFTQEFDYLLEDQGYKVLSRTDTSIHVQGIATKNHLLAEINDFITDNFEQHFPHKGVCYSEWENKHQFGGIDVHRLHVEIEDMTHEISIDVKERPSDYQVLVGMYMNIHVSQGVISGKNLSPEGQKQIVIILKWMVHQITEHPHYRLPFVTNNVEFHYTNITQEVRSEIHG